MIYFVLSYPHYNSLYVDHRFTTSHAVASLDIIHNFTRN